MVPDLPIEDPAHDRLKFGAYAGVFTAFFLDEKTPTPMTVAISGPWGSGKTSLARLIDGRLRAPENWRGRLFEQPLTCWFNAWHHADAPNVGVALAAHVARNLAPERPLWVRALQPLPTAMMSPSRRWWRRIWQGVGAALLAVMTLVAMAWLIPPLREKLGAIGALPGRTGDPVAWFVAGSALVALVARAFKAGGTLGTYLEAPRDVAAQGSIAEVREHLKVLVRQALGRSRRLVIFIDDLERCPADKALGVCEVDHPGVIAVLVSDLAPLAAAAAERYKEDDAAVLQASVRSAFETVGQLFVHCMFPLLIITSFDVAPVHAAWITPLGVALSSFALKFGVPTPRAVGPSVKLGLYVTAPSILFNVVWPLFPVGTVGHAVLVFGSSAVVAILFEVVFFFGSFRSDVAEQRSRSAEAEREMAAGHDQATAEPDVSSANLDRRLRLRYLKARKDAEEEVRRFLPTNPRTAKRMVNHVSLAMAIAEERRLFDDPVITQQHLAKWIGISEQWPELGAVLTTSPEHMGELASWGA